MGDAADFVKVADLQDHAAPAGHLGDESRVANDGGWPATTRQPGVDSYAQRISTTGWALMALLAATAK